MSENELFSFQIDAITKRELRQVARIRDTSMAEVLRDLVHAEYEALYMSAPHNYDDVIEEILTT